MDDFYTFLLHGGFQLVIGLPPQFSSIDGFSPWNHQLWRVPWGRSRLVAEAQLRYRAILGRWWLASYLQPMVIYGHLWSMAIDGDRCAFFYSRNDETWKFRWPNAVKSPTKTICLLFKMIDWYHSISQMKQHAHGKNAGRISKQNIDSHIKEWQQTDKTPVCFPHTDHWACLKTGYLFSWWQKRQLRGVFDPWDTNVYYAIFLKTPLNTPILLLNPHDLRIPTISILFPISNPLATSKHPDLPLANWLECSAPEEWTECTQHLTVRVLVRKLGHQLSRQPVVMSAVSKSFEVNCSELHHVCYLPKSL